MSPYFKLTINSYKDDSTSLSLQTIQPISNWSQVYVIGRHPLPVAYQYLEHEEQILTSLCYCTTATADLQGSCAAGSTEQVMIQKHHVQSSKRNK